MTLLLSACASQAVVDSGCAWVRPIVVSDDQIIVLSNGKLWATSITARFTNCMKSRITVLSGNPNFSHISVVMP